MTPRPFLFPVLLALAASLPAQTLAHRNWAGSGIVVEPWYAHAVLYQVDPLLFQGSTPGSPGDLRGLTSRLDYLQTLAPDALLLSPLALDPDPSRGNSEADFDQLLAAAGQHHLRILVDLPASTPDLLARARFWLTRGVAGLRLVAIPGPTASVPPETLFQLRRLVASYPGERLLLNDLPGPDIADPGIRIDRTLSNASTLTLPVLQTLAAGPPSRIASRKHREAKAPSQVLLQSDSPAVLRSWTRLEPDPLQREATARLLATILFTTPAGTILYFGQEIGMASPANTPAAPGNPLPDPTRMPWEALPFAHPATPGTVAAEEADPHSLLNFYRDVAALHHGNPALRTGSSEILPLGIPGLLAYLRRPASGSPVLVMLNLTAQPVVLSLRPALTHLGLGAASLRTLLRSIPADPTRPAAEESTDTLHLAPRSSFLGELRLHPGLEAAHTPPHRR